MPTIFLSYRHQDAPGLAGRIYDRLEAKFGRDNVFMDVDSIPFGLDFRKHLAARLRAGDRAGRPLSVRPGVSKDALRPANTLIEDNLPSRKAL